MSNPNFINFDQPYGSSRIPQEQEQNLLDDDTDKSSHLTAMQIQDNRQFINANPFNQSNVNHYQSNNNFNLNSQPKRNENSNSIPSSNLQNYNSNLSQQNQSIIEPAQTVNHKMRETLARFDQDLMELIKLNEKGQQKTSVDKIVSQNQEKNRKAMSRLSQQFFPKSGNNEGVLKSQRKGRKTVAAFGIELKKQTQPQKRHQPIFDFKRNQNKSNQKSLFANQKIEIQNQDISNRIMMQKPLIQRKQQFSLGIKSPQAKNRNLNQEQKKPAQARLSEAKKNRNRLSSGIQSMLQTICTIPGSKSKKQIVEQDPRKKRITLDFRSLAKLYQPSVQTKINPQKFILPSSNQNKSSFEIEQKQSIVKRPLEKSRRMTQYARPVIKELEPVILQDQKQDEFTPLKQVLSNQLQKNESNLKPMLFSHQKIDFITSSLPQNKQLRMNESFDDQKYVFDNIFANVKQRLNEQKIRVEQLKQQKQLVIKKNKQAVSRYGITGAMLARMRQQDTDIRTQIFGIRPRINKVQYEKNRQIIQQFQVQLGIQLHSLQKFPKTGTHNNQNDGFFIQFTYDDIIFRIKNRQSINDCTAKFLQMPNLKNQQIGFKLGFQQKTGFIQSYISKKLKKVKLLYPFMANLINYCKQLTKFQLTVDQLSLMFNFKDISLSESKHQIQLTLQMIQELSFRIDVNMMELTSMGGINIVNLTGLKQVNIPEQLLIYGKNKNKFAECVAYLDQYASKQIIRILGQCQSEKL